MNECLPDKKLLKLEEVVFILGVSERHIWRLVSAGECPAPVRLGRACRWVYEEITNYLEQLKNKRA